MYDSVADEPQAPTQTMGVVPFRTGDFSTLCEALDYAAQANTGFNFYAANGDCLSTLTYASLQRQAMALGRRLSAFAPSEARIGLVADTSPEFAVAFFACQYAGLVPVPMPTPVTLGGRDSYEHHLRLMVESADLSAMFAPHQSLELMYSALKGLQLPIFDMGCPDIGDEEDRLRPHGADGLCYIQYSSGSTSAPKGIIGTQAGVTANCQAIIRYGVEAKQDDRIVSWLPLYHDMGLIAFLMAPMMSQLNVDYLAPLSFARRPATWLKLLSENKGTISCSPAFGYELCSRRWRNGMDLDLSSWRVAGIGADMVRKSALDQFCKTFGSYGFRDEALVACYGLAEATLGVSFSPVDRGLKIDEIDMERMRRTDKAIASSDITRANARRTFVSCGRILPGIDVEIRDNDGQALTEREVGHVCLKGPSVTPGYFRNEAATRNAFTSDGWLDTGDLGYWLDGELFITGRSKDLLLWHGRNIWPQDLELIAEALGGKRIGRAAAFSVRGEYDEDEIVLLAECRSREPDVIVSLREEIAAAVRLDAGAPVKVLMVQPNSLVVTSSGKLSRARVKAKYRAGGYVVLDTTATTSEPLAADSN